jgi:hypothetical protein
MGTIGNTIKNSNSTRNDIGDVLNTLEDMIVATGKYYAATVGGSANAITLTPSPALSSYAAGNEVSFVALSTNTSAVTVNISGLGNRALYSGYTEEALVGGEIQSNGIYTAKDNGTRLYLYNGLFNQKKVPLYVGTSGGSANAQTISPGKAGLAYTAGETWLFKAVATNTGPMTIDRDGLGARAVHDGARMSGILKGGEVRSGGVYIIVENSGNFLLLNPCSAVVKTYTPTRTLGTNAAAATVYDVYYKENFDDVELWGRIDIDPTATGATIVYLTIPIASNFTYLLDAVGGINCDSVNQHGAIYADTTNDRLQIQYVATSTANAAFFFHAKYLKK